MPGQGKYTNYTPIGGSSAEAYKSRFSLFNAKAADGKGDFFGESGGNVKSYIQKAAEILQQGQGDAQIFGKVFLDFTYDNKTTDLQDASLKNAGDPANPFMPDISSPGAIDGAVNVDAKSKSGQGKIGVEDVKPNYIVANGILGADAQNLGTQSPSETSGLIGQTSIDKSLTMGKSKGTLGGG